MCRTGTGEENYVFRSCRLIDFYLAIDQPGHAITTSSIPVETWAPPVFKCNEDHPPETRVHDSVWLMLRGLFIMV